MKRAIILVAGFGSRLRPLTEEEPKCLTEIRGEPILLRTLEVLEKRGVREAAVVIGYMGDKIIEKIGTKIDNLSIKYIKNDIYDRTNSMYSLWLARDFLEKGAIVIEGDCVFEEDVIERALEYKGTSVWVADRFTREMDGSMSTTDDSGRITEVRIVREKLKEYKDNYFKSAGIVKVMPDLGNKFSKWLDEDVKKGNINIYYDLVLAKHINEHSIFVCNITGLKWFEIDDLKDLENAERMFQPTKYVMIIPDGAADFKIEELSGKTPLEYANIPSIDRLAKEGKNGILQTSFKGLPIGSIVANIGILGYNPLRYYPNGRASFEALAQEIYLDEGDIAFRCNLISIKDDKIKDFTADWIPDDIALEIIDSLNFGNGVELYYGQSYRNILVLRNAKIDANEIIGYEPHMNIGKPIKEKMLEGKTEKGKKIADMLNNIMLESQKKISELNKKLKTKADMIWLWSPSSPPNLPPFFVKNKIHGAVVAGLDFMRGIAVSANMHTKEIRGATGMLDTNLKEKLKYTKNFLRNNDFVFVHVNAPDEESHRKTPKTKVLALERIEKEIVKPIIEHLNKAYPNNYRIAILPDHYTLLKDGTHIDKPVPFLIFGKGVKKDSVASFSEREIEKVHKKPMKSYDFMKVFTAK